MRKRREDETLAQSLERQSIADVAATRRLVAHLANELKLLRAAWVIAGDDNRQRKPLSVGPGDVRRWSKLIRRADGGGDGSA